MITATIMSDLRLVCTMTLTVLVLVTAAVAVRVAASTSPVREMSSSAQWATLKTRNIVNIHSVPERGFEGLK